MSTLIETLKKYLISNITNASYSFSPYAYWRKGPWWIFSMRFCLELFIRCFLNIPQFPLPLHVSKWVYFFLFSSFRSDSICLLVLYFVQLMRLTNINVCWNHLHIFRLQIIYPDNFTLYFDVYTQHESWNRMKIFDKDLKLPHC